MTSPEPMEASQLAAAAADIVQSIDGLREEVAAQKSYGRRNRWLIRVVIVSVILDFLLSLGLVFLFGRVQHAADLAREASSAQRVACLAGNETRAIQTDLWNTILAFPPPPGELPAAAVIREQRTEEFRTYIGQAFKSQDCDEVRG